MNKTHGLTNHPIFQVWVNMRARCRRTDYNYYKDVHVCEEWNDFMHFFYWAIFSGWEVGLTIDRINNKGNYEPSNCRWATRLTQSQNRDWVISTKQVKLIKALLYAGCEPIAIARELNIGRHVISYINTNKGWTNINP